MFLFLKINFHHFFCQSAFYVNAIPKYRDNVYDPVPEKTTHLENNKENTAYNRRGEWFLNK